jgi:hypothetical protein
VRERRESDEAFQAQKLLLETKLSQAVEEK